MFADIYREPFIVQRYLEAVRKGDKRIILLDGTPVGAINRIPTKQMCVLICMLEVMRKMLR